MGRELALCYEEKRQVYRRRGALGGQEELFKPAGMEAAAATEARQAAAAVCSCQQQIGNKKAARHVMANVSLYHPVEPSGLAVPYGPQAM